MFPTGEALSVSRLEPDREFAELAETTGVRHSSDSGAIAWHRESRYIQACPVGGKRLHAFGLHSLLRHVWVRAQDHSSRYPRGTAIESPES